MVCVCAAVVDGSYDEIVEGGEVARSAGGGLEPKRIFAWVGLEKAGGSGMEC